MSRLVKIVNNKYVQIEEYKNPNICFNTNEYDNFEDYCTLRETFDPFEIFYENQELKKQLEEYKDNYNCLLKQKELDKYKRLVEHLKTLQLYDYDLDYDYDDDPYLNYFVFDLDYYIDNWLKCEEVD